jgi:Amt family ammonium transporter
VVHPAGAFVIGAAAGVLFTYLFAITQNRWKIDDVLGVWPLHGLCGAWGGIACGIFGSKALGGMGGVAFMSQLAGTLLGIVVAVVGGLIVYGGIKAVSGIRLDEEAEFSGTDLSTHHIHSEPERAPGSRQA